MKDLVLSPAAEGKSLRLYNKMQTAIAQCHSMDECRNVADQAAAIAAYYKQTKDDISMKKFLEIKMRAWRRIGELLNAVDTSDCETFAARCRKYRAVAGLGDMTDAHLKQAVEVAALPVDFFESAVGTAAGSSIVRLLSTYGQLQREQWVATPEGREALKKQEERNAARLAEVCEEAAAEERKLADERQRAEEEARFVDTLKGAHAEAVREDQKDGSLAVQDLRNAGATGVGITLDRRDRMKMHTTVFLLREPIHEALRKAALSIA